MPSLVKVCHDYGEVFSPFLFGLYGGLAPRLLILYVTWRQAYEARFWCEPPYEYFIYKTYANIMLGKLGVCITNAEALADVICQR